MGCAARPHARSSGTCALDAAGAPGGGGGCPRIATIGRKHRAFATAVWWMPVLPAVPLTIVPPGLSLPRFSATRILGMLFCMFFLL